MAMYDVLKAVGLLEQAEKGREVYADILSRVHNSEPGYGEEIRNLSEEDFENYAIYHAQTVLDLCNFTDVVYAKELPSSIESMKVTLCKDYKRQL